MLPDWHGVCGRWHPSPFLENFIAIFHTPDLQFPSLRTSTLRGCSVSSASSSKVSLANDFFPKTDSCFCFNRFDSDTNLLHPSKAQFLTPPSRLSAGILHIFSKLGLVELTLHSKDGSILEVTNLTILNFFLVRLGPMNEKRLNQVLMASQV